MYDDPYVAGKEKEWWIFWWTCIGLRGRFGFLGDRTWVLDMGCLVVLQMVVVVVLGRVGSNVGG